MTKKIIAIAVVMAVTLAYTVAPAMAYTLVTGTSVQAITASGTITGNVVAFSAVVADTTGAQIGTGTSLAFASPSGKKVNARHGIAVAVLCSFSLFFDEDRVLCGQRPNNLLGDDLCPFRLVLTRFWRFFVLAKTDETFWLFFRKGFFFGLWLLFFMPKRLYINVKKNEQ